MKETILEEERVLPVLAVRGLVVFPGMIVQFDIGRKKSVLAAKAALDTDSRELFIVTQTDLSESEPMAEDLYKIGVIARIKQVVHTADNGIKLHVEGIERAEIMSVVQNEPYLTGSVCVCKPIAARHTLCVPLCYRNRNSSIHLMHPSLQLLHHASGMFYPFRLAKDLPFKSHNRIRPDHNGIPFGNLRNIQTFQP